MVSPLRLEVTGFLSEYGINSLSKRYMELDVSPQFDGYSGVEIVVDDETTYFAGNTNGRIITIQNPWGTQEQANNILSSLMGFQYQPYTASGALLNPAAELGDGVSLNGLYSGLYKIDRNYSSLMSTEISAPQDEEIDHEYPFETKGNREITRKFMAVQSEFTLQSNEIAAKVSQTGGDNTSFGWNLLSDHFSLFSGSSEVFRVDSSGATVKGTITATDGKIGNFNIGSNAIWNNISEFSNPGGLSSGVYLGTDGIRLGRNFSVNSSGGITANNATLTGTLTVGGETISAATLRSGAQSAYNNGSYWSGGAGGGYGFINATNRNSGSYPSYFKATAISCTTLGVSTLEVGSRGIYINGTYYTQRSKTISGVTITYLGV